jgi:hypothetical protein
MVSCLKLGAVRGTGPVTLDVMTKTKVYPIRLFFTSLGAGILLLLSICYYLEDFSSQKIFEIMFWVGGLLLVAGVTIFLPYNPYMGSTLAITTQLRHNSKGQRLESSDRDTRERSVRGMSIAAPGIIMIGVSYFFSA